MEKEKSIEDHSDIKEQDLVMCLDTENQQRVLSDDPIQVTEPLLPQQEMPLVAEADQIIIIRGTQEGESEVR